MTFHIEKLTSAILTQFKSRDYEKAVDSLITSEIKKNNTIYLITGAVLNIEDERATFRKIKRCKIFIKRHKSEIINALKGYNKNNQYSPNEKCVGNYRSSIFNISKICDTLLEHFDSHQRKAKEFFTNILIYRSIYN